MKYLDKYGDRWTRISLDGYSCYRYLYVKRLKDGMIGGWFDGDGLILI